MASAHIIEVGGRAAGIVIREHGGLRFFASERAFQALEGALFRTYSIRPREPRASASGPRGRPTAFHLRIPDEGLGLDSCAVAKRVGWCAMSRGGRPWRGLLII